ncbi:hypothetical protein EI94DRAFT_93760 [Lactarius quietus]|nr:hypothetical protein EI94DRAFT_93760 [Lactarius quietus]
MMRRTCTSSCALHSMNDDAAMIEVFQIVCSEMHEAIKMLQRALEHVVEGGQMHTEESGDDAVNRRILDF